MRREMQDHMMLRYLRAISGNDQIHHGDDNSSLAKSADEVRTLVDSWSIFGQVSEIRKREALFKAWCDDPLQQVLVYHANILPNEMGNHGGPDCTSNHTSDSAQVRTDEASADGIYKQYSMGGKTDDSSTPEKFLRNREKRDSRAKQEMPFYLHLHSFHQLFPL